MSGDPVPILEKYMELVIQFGFISLFSIIFPLASLMSFISNSILIQSKINNLVYYRRQKAEVSNGIGNWMICIQILS